MVFAAFFIGGAQKKTPTPYRWSGLRRSGAQWRSMALRHSERDCSGLLATFDLFNDDGAQKQRKTDAPRQKVEIHGGGLVTAFDFLNDDGANDKGDGKAPRQKI